MTIHIEVNESGEKTLVVYDPKKHISFFRPLFGIELDMNTHVLFNRIRSRIRKWEKSNTASS